MERVRPSILLRPGKRQSGTHPLYKTTFALEEVREAERLERMRQHRESVDAQVMSKLRDGKDRDYLETVLAEQQQRAEAEARELRRDRYLIAKGLELESKAEERDREERERKRMQLREIMRENVATARERELGAKAAAQRENQAELERLRQEAFDRRFGSSLR